MSRLTNLPLARALAAANSAYPPSFDGSTVRFQLALFSIMSMSILAFMTLYWITKEMIRHRHDSYPWEPLFAVRSIILFCSLQTFIRCTPEAVYMICYRESSLWLIGLILAVKRWADAVSIMPALAWMGVVWAFYIRISTNLLIVIDGDDPRARQLLTPRLAKPQLRRFGVALALVFVISALIAAGKLR